MPKTTANNKTVQVVIHSQTDSYESLDVFRERGYTIKLEETPLSDVWTELITADVFIMSRSSFSIVPGIFNRGKVVYAPYMLFDKLPHWDAADAALLQRSKQEAFDMFRHDCTSFKHLRSEKSGVVFLLRYGPKRFFYPK
jgi:hypothetical protein